MKFWGMFLFWLIVQCWLILTATCEDGTESVKNMFFLGRKDVFSSCVIEELDTWEVQSNQYNYHTLLEIEMDFLCEL